MLKKESILVEGVEIQISYKKIKNLNLKVGIDGQVNLSVPKFIPRITIDKFINSKLDWIKDNLDKFSESIKFSNKKLQNGEKHFVLGQEKTLKVIDKKMKHSNICIENETNLVIEINQNVSQKTKERHLNQWYENLLIKETENYFKKWEQVLGVSKSKLIIKKMKGKWGYCDIRTKNICLNLELTKRNLEFIEYVVLHELCHLIVPNHGSDFKKLLNQHLPNWKNIKTEID
jgi:hypothetical protein